MTELHTELIKRAEEKYGKILPAGHRKLEECFTEEDGKLILWFNDTEESTHMEIENVN